jgi:anti-sigma28 factor (negative regulator of flagellin synthesis)
MDRVDNASSPHRSPLHQREVIPSQARAEEHSAESAWAPDRVKPAVLDRCEVARRLAAAFEAREAKLRELQDAIKHGIYRVTPEQIAAKMLQHLLRE